MIKRTLILIAVCVTMTGCLSIRTSAIVLASSIDIYATIKIEESTPEERATLRADLVATQAILTLVDASIEAKIVLIDSLPGVPEE